RGHYAHDGVAAPELLTLHLHLRSSGVYRRRTLGATTPRTRLSATSSGPQGPSRSARRTTQPHSPSASRVFCIIPESGGSAVSICVSDVLASGWETSVEMTVSLGPMSMGGISMGGTSMVP